MMFIYHVWLFRKFLQLWLHEYDVSLLLNIETNLIVDYTHKQRVHTLFMLFVFIYVYWCPTGFPY
jgi:hypothetical protein